MAREVEPVQAQHDTRPLQSTSNVPQTFVETANAREYHPGDEDYRYSTEILQGYRHISPVEDEKMERVRCTASRLGRLYRFLSMDY